MDKQTEINLNNLHDCYSNNRLEAMYWWNNLKLTERVLKMNEFGIEPYRSSDSLTGSEIEKLYNLEHK